MGNKLKPEDFNYWFYRPKNDLRFDWRNGEDNWIQGYVKSIIHPHRKLVLDALENFNWKSLLELGCNAGPNLFLIQQLYPEADLAGIDANPDAIKEAEKNLHRYIDLKVENLIKLPYPDSSFDIVLADAVLMYISNLEIAEAIKEVNRIAKKGVILIEWDSDSIGGVIKDFHWARNYKKIFENFGFKVKKHKITKEEWPSKNWTKNGYLYIAVRQ